jgi:hypothetical protein
MSLPDSVSPDVPGSPEPCPMSWGDQFRRGLLTSLLVIILSSCVRSPFPPPAPVEDDKSIVMPRFYDLPTIIVGERGKYYYELDGEVLRAVAIAASDFLPPRTRNLSCGNRLEAQRYLVSRRGNIIFVYIYEDSEYCGGGYVALDSGVKYAISKDGRILRRIFDGQREEPLEWVSPDGGDLDALVEPGVVPGFEPIERKSSGDGGPGASPSLSPEEQDGGSPLDGGTARSQPAPVPDGGDPPDAGSPPDGGSP